MALRTLDSVKHLARRTVLVRIGCDVPMQVRKIVDDARLREILPTVRYLERKRARIILAGHLGRPSGKVVPTLSLKPIGYTLGKLLRHKVKVMPLDNPHAIRQAAKTNIVLLENLRFNPGEDKNDRVFVKILANLADLYVNEAFSVCHRTSASIVGVPKYLPSYAGFNLAAEVAALQKIKQRGQRPVVAIIGGAKVADKLPVIAKLLPRVKAVLTGGGVANTFLAAKGYKIGSSLVDKSVIPAAKRLLRSSKGRIILPIDVIVQKTGNRKKTHDWCLVNKVVGKDKIVDLGTATTQLYASLVKEAKTIFWSGPLGLIEEPVSAHASLALGRLVSARSHRHSFVLIGGGDTAAFFHKHELTVSQVSTAGGALLDFLSGNNLPGLKALGYR
ncbi:MAG: phosphoglycerate kinase [Candidatus Kerfeldbacteria bacterium]|nr:phosphoglycerate kinase [Candidatus Kerfeldbacteria bacterium]